MDYLRKVYQKTIPYSIRERSRSWRIRMSDPAERAWLFSPQRWVMRNRLSAFRDLYAGERCIIMGNGPSLNKMDLELFHDEFVWGSNRCYLLFDRISWRPRFFVAVDTRVVPDISDEVNLLAHELPNTSFFFPSGFSYRGIIKSNSNVIFYQEKAMDKSNLPNGMFSQDVSKWVTSVRTVTIAAMQLAVFMGFNPIYLIGCDTSYAMPTSARYEDGAKSQIVSNEDDDINHFDPRYFGKGKKWHEPKPNQMIYHYEQARQVCDGLGVNVYNATVGGKLEVFPRINYLDIFK